MTVTPFLKMRFMLEVCVFMFMQVCAYSTGQIAFYISDYLLCLLWALWIMVRAKMISWRQLIVELGQKAKPVVSRCFAVCGSLGII